MKWQTWAGRLRHHANDLNMAPLFGGALIGTPSSERYGAPLMSGNNGGAGRRKAMYTRSTALAARLVLLLSMWATIGASHMQAQIAESAMVQIANLQAEKASRSPVQRKIGSQLLYAAKMKRNQPIAEGVPALRMDVESDPDGRVLVDIDATVTDELLNRINQVGGKVVSSVPRFDAVRAWLPIDQVEPMAARNDVKYLKPAVKAVKNVGTVTSQGDQTHLAALARNQFGVTGAGVKVGILSDSADYLETSQALGDLGPVTILPGQAGLGSGEGTAMLEIVHDIAPDAELFFATAFTSAASFAQNILDLAEAGCDIIADDVIYLDESPFQDDLIARAVNSVTAQGVLFFSSAGNSGNKTDGSSGTWEGDFVDSGTSFTVNGQSVGQMHSFGGKLVSNKVTTTGYAGILFWSDPLGASSNDYDLYILSPNGRTIVGASTSIQDGTQDPIESIGALFKNDQVVIVQYSGEPRFLHFENFRGRLAVSTAGNIRGHNSATDAFAVAATPAATAIGPAPNPKGPFPGPFGSANQLERFSSDGPRRVFFEEDGTPITPGDFLSSGGQVRQKPDITAADGVLTTLPEGSGLNPFYGTSAAAPHAAAIAALVKSFQPDLTAAQVRTALTTSAIDIEATGLDRDSGHGIVMADRALAALFESFTVSVSAAPPGGGTVTGEGVFSPNNTVTVTASPAASFRFVNWTEEGAVVSTSSSYTFTLTQDRTLVANFAPGPTIGTYYGLITTSPVSFETSGQIRLTMTQRGRFSAALVLGGHKYSFTGSFDIFGRFRGRVTLRDREPLSIELSLEPFGEGISGSVRDDTHVMSLVANRAAYKPGTNPAPQAGRYTILSMPADPFRNNPAFPQGYGAGAMVIDKGGRVRIVKTLGDGTKLTHASAISTQGTWPFYKSIYRGKGAALGFIQIENKPTSDGEGIVDWFKPPLPNQQFYPSGFEMQSVFLISRYTPPEKEERILSFPDSPNNGIFTVDDGNLNPLPPPTLITLTQDAKVLKPPGDKLELKFALRSGQFYGWFINPGTNEKRRFTGAVFQKQSIGAGWFRGNREIGSVSLEPAALPSRPVGSPTVSRLPSR